MLTHLGLSQKSMVECKVSILGTEMIGIIMKRSQWPKTKSAANMVSSVILQRNSRAGWDTECQPMEYHFPVQKAMFDWSVLNSRVRASETMSLIMNRCKEMTAIIPERVRLKLNPSKKNITSKNTSRIMTAMA